MDDTRFSIDNPLRPVNWRSQIAEKLRRAAGFPSPRRYDRATSEIAAYVRLRNEAGHASHRRGSINPRYADLHQAFDLREASYPRLLAVVEAMLLTDSDIATIASQIGVSAACIEWYSAAFFDVRNRRSSAHFILHHVIEQCRARSGDWCQWGWKLIGYLGGHAALDEAMSARKVKSLQELTPLLQQETRLVLLARARHFASDLSNDNAGAIATLLRVFVTTGKSSDEHVPNDYEENVQAMLRCIPWAVGESADSTSPLAEFDGCAAELRADEMMILTMGMKLPHGEKLKAMKFPDPPPHSER